VSLKVCAVVNPVRKPRPDTSPFENVHELEFREEPSRDCDLVLLFGGDGTLNRHLARLVEAKVPVLCVPTGSGNDFAMAHGIFDSVDALGAFERFVRGEVRVRESDLGTIATARGQRYFSCCANIGMDADAARRTNALPNWLKESGGYFFGGLGAMLGYQQRRLTVAGDGVPNGKLSERGWFVSISNTPTFGGGLEIAPQAKLDDSILDVTYCREVPRRELLWHYPKILRGAHTNLEQLHIFKSSQLRIETESPQPIYADGEYIGEAPCEIGVASRALKVLTAGA
jgi:diacylglycerol kinase family enzyme